MKELSKRGVQVIDDAAAADRVIDDCVVLVGDDEMNVCTDGLRAIEDRLIAGLTKPIDGPVSRHLNRKVSGALTRRLMYTSIRPNHVTAVTMLLGIASGFVVAMGGYWAGVAGAGLLQLQSVLDGTDGELSRLRFQGSKLGEWLDTLSDDLSNLSFLLGASYVASHDWVGKLGFIGAGLFLLTQPVLYYAIATVYRSGNLQAFQWDVGGGPFAKIEFCFKRDFFCLLFFALALLGWLDVAVVFFAGGTIVTAVVLAKQLAKWGFRRPSPRA